MLLAQHYQVDVHLITGPTPNQLTMPLHSIAHSIFPLPPLSLRGVPQSLSGLLFVQQPQAPDLSCPGALISGVCRFMSAVSILQRDDFGSLHISYCQLLEPM